MASTQSRPSEDIPSEIVTASIVWHGADSLIVCLRCALRSGKMRCAAVSCVFLTMCWLPLSQARGSSSSCNYKAYRYGKRMVGLPRPCKGPSRCPVFVRLESHRTSEMSAQLRAGRWGSLLFSHAAVGTSSSTRQRTVMPATRMAARGAGRKEGESGGQSDYQVLDWRPEPDYPVCCSLNRRRVHSAYIVGASQPLRLQPALSKSGTELHHPHARGLGHVYILSAHGSG